MISTFIGVTDFKKLKSFFWGLKQSRYNIERIPFRDPQGIPIEKEYCLNLLRSLPEFKDDEFKNPEKLVEHFKELSEKGQLKHILNPYTALDQQSEFAEIVKELPEEDPSTQIGPSEQAASGETPTGEPASSMGGQDGGAFGMPSGGGDSSGYNPSRRIAVEPRSGMEGGTGTGTAATNKAAAIQAEKNRTMGTGTAATGKGNVPVSGMRGGTGSGTGAIGKSGLQAPRIPYSVTNSLQNANSGAQIAANRAGARLGSGLSNFFKNTGRAGGGFLGGAIGGGGNALGRLYLRAGNLGGKFMSELPKSGVGGVANKRLALVLLGSLMFMFIGAALIGIFSSGGTTPTTPGVGTTPTTSTTSRLTLNKSGSPEVAAGEDISYEITINYTGGGTADIEISDRLPAQVEFKSASDGGNNDSGLVKWYVANLGAGSSKKLSLTVTAKAGIDAYAQNTAEAKILSSTGNPSGVIDINNTSLAEIFDKAAANANIPVAFLKAIGSTESDVLSYNAFEVVKFSTPGWWVGLESEAPTREQNHPDIRRGYGYNTCKYLGNACLGPTGIADVRGAMQFELGTWNGIKGQLTILNHEPFRQNLTDVVFGAGVNIKNKAIQYGYSLGNTWPETTVRAVARSYCAGSPSANIFVAACGWNRAGDLTYDDKVWIAYQRFSR